MTPFLLVVILATVTLSAIAQFALKLGVAAPNVAALMGHGGRDLILAVVSSPLIWAGLSIYGLSVLVWLWVLSKVELSVAYPFVGVSFVITALLSATFLHESLTPQRTIGTALIVMGCVLVARSA